MDTIRKIRLIERLDYLIRRKATGTPKELSSRFGLSERQVYNIICDMKLMGAPIVFCGVRKSYCYKEEVVFKFGFFLDEDPVLKDLTGGLKPLYNFDLIEIFPIQASDSYITL